MSQLPFKMCTMSCFIFLEKRLKKSWKNICQLFQRRMDNNEFLANRDLTVHELALEGDIKVGWMIVLLSK